MWLKGIQVRLGCVGKTVWRQPRLGKDGGWVLIVVRLESLRMNLLISLSSLQMSQRVNT